MFRLAVLPGHFALIRIDFYNLESDLTFHLMTYEDSISAKAAVMEDAFPIPLFLVIFTAWDAGPCVTSIKV